MQNGVAVNDADEVTVDGFMARGYKANGFFFTNLNGYTMNHLIARQTGVYGLYAFNTIGGKILNSEAYYVNDGAFYIGQTPPQAKPIRTMVRNVDGWGSPLGFSATNMRYVTITKSRFYNNALGIAPERAGRREVPAGRGQRDHRQRHLLEQLQLPRRATRRSPCARPASPRSRRSAPGSSCSAAAATGSRTTASTATTSPASSAVESILVEKTPEARIARATTSIQNNQFGPQRHRHQRPRHRLRRQRDQQLLLDGRRDVDVPGRRLDVRGLRRRERVQQGRAGHDARLDRRGRADAWKKHAAPGQAGYTPLEVFK